jgi:hypothetical protein
MPAAASHPSNIVWDGQCMKDSPQAAGVSQRERVGRLGAQAAESDDSHEEKPERREEGDREDAGQTEDRLE